MARILYNPDDGEIFYVVLNQDWFLFSPSVNITLAEKYVDEVEPENSPVFQDLVKNLRRRDQAGDQKYSIDADGDLFEKEGWTEYRRTSPI